MLNAFQNMDLASHKVLIQYPLMKIILSKVTWVIVRHVVTFWYEDFFSCPLNNLIIISFTDRMFILYIRGRHLLIVQTRSD